MKNLILLLAIFLGTIGSMAAQRHGGGHISVRIDAGHHGNHGNHGVRHGNHGHHSNHGIRHGNNRHNNHGHHNNNHGHHNNHGHNHWSSWTPCCSNDYNRIVRRVKAECFESDRLRVAKSLACQYHFSTSQLRSIMGLFSFESSRLEFAKYAYHYTCDRGNYSSLYACFSFRSSIRELNHYISCH